jgi:phage I-like protein
MKEVLVDPCTTIRLAEGDSDVMGYWVDLQKPGVIAMDDPAMPTSTWIQAMPIGEYEHPVHGKISFTPERVKQFAQGVKEKWRGQELDIDYDHKAKDGAAAGWVKDAEGRDDGLWILVEWTKDAYQKLKDKAYRYFSPEFVAWEHPKTKTKYKDVLLGGALTNRPFLKDILPINLSEVIESNANPKSASEGGSMTPEQIKQLAKLLGLPEDATAEQVLGGLLLKLTPQEPGADPNAPDPNETPEQKATRLKKEQEAAAGGGSGSGASGAQQVAASELPAELKQLAETNPTLAKYLDEQRQQAEADRKKLEENAVALRLAEVDGNVVKLSEFAATKKRGFPPVVIDSFKELMLKAPKELPDVGFVELGERGGSRTEDGGDAIKRFTDAVDVKIKNGNITYADAVEAVSAEQPQLFEEYRQASFAGRE